MKILHSNIIGSGPPLLILHGYFGMSDNWKTLALKYAKYFEVHLIDQRNHGRSFHDDAFDYEILVADLHAYIDYHQLNRVHLLGHSMGGKVVMQFAVNYPGLVEKLVVADIAPKYYKPHHGTILEALNTVNFSIQDSRQKVADLLKIYIKEPEVLQFLLKNLYRKDGSQLGFRFNLQSLTENNSEVGEALPSNTTFEGPTLFLRGERSNYILDEDMELIHDHFFTAIVVTVKNAGHWLHADNPDQFFDETVRFLI